MKIFVVRLNPDTRDCRAYSRYPTKSEYEAIHGNSPMNGFHEAVNFLPEQGIVRGYLPPKHLSAMRGVEPFALITITAKSAKVNGDQVVGIQAGCIYQGETARGGGTRDSKSLGLTWHYYCPESLSVLLPKPVHGARSLILGSNGVWVRGATHKVGPDVLHRIVKEANRVATNSAISSKLKLIVGIAVGKEPLPKPEIETELSFEQDILAAMAEDLSNVKGNENPKQRAVITYQYVRDQKVVAHALKMANGICADCGEKPFVSRVTGLPYLEVHHIVTLKDGGKDTPENVVALCPNCHRQRHYG